MPAIAKEVRREGAQFYWHLGDFRALTKYDEDIIHAKGAQPLDIDDYQQLAWKDFIQREIMPFGPIPVYLGIGNHELVPPKTRLEYLVQFADWIDTPGLKVQRLQDDSSDHLLKTYYHWIHGGVDFINLDNASHDEFDNEQLKWFEKVLGQAEQNADIKSVVVGMHAALPDSLAASHSMNDSAQGRESGRRAYADLLDFQGKTSKPVYILASHSHFFMSNIFNTDELARRSEVLPGWIVGTAGAVRYRLPADHTRADQALTDVYGFLVGHVSPSGKINFEFHRVNEQDVPEDVTSRLGRNLVHDCFEGNRE